MLANIRRIIDDPSVEFDPGVGLETSVKPAGAEFQFGSYPPHLKHPPQNERAMKTVRFKNPATGGKVDHPGKSNSVYDLTGAIRR